MANISKRLTHAIGPLTAVTVVLVEALVGLADIRRSVFLIVSVVAGVLALTLAVWYFVRREMPRGLAATGGFVLVVVIGVLGAPQGDVSPASASVAAAPTITPSFDTDNGEVVLEEPSEADALFNSALVSVTPWYNDILFLFRDATIEDPEGEAALNGAWWALADWCVEEGHGSEGRCYDLAGLYTGKIFDRDPRTINDETWYGAGTAGVPLTAGYDRTAGYLGIEKSGLIPELVEGRPNLSWQCEPSCTAGILDQ